MKLAEGAPAGGEVWASPPPTAEETEALPLAEKRLHFSRSAAYASISAMSYSFWILYMCRHPDTAATREFYKQVPANVYMWPMVAFATAILLNLLSMVFERRPVKRQLCFLAVFISGVAFVYEFLAWNQVAPIYITAAGRPVSLLRYVMWAHATPLMLYALSMISDFSSSQIGWTLAADIAMIVTVIPGELVFAWHRWIWNFISCAIYPYIFHQLWRMYGAAIKEAGADGTQTSLRILRNITVVFWSVFPLVWVLVQLDWVTVYQEELLWCCADTLGKIFFSSTLLHSNFMSIEHRRMMAMRVVEEANRIRVIHELRQLVEQKEAFIALMSHELRTPLNGIIGLSNVLLTDSDALAGDTPKTLTTIRNSGARLLNLINDILDAAALRKGKLVVQQGKVNLRNVADDVIDLCSALAKPGVSLRNKIPASTVAVVGDTSRIVQVLYNLVGNACKFTERGDVYVTAAVVGDGDVVSVSVHDSGIGIPQARLDDIFAPFAQVDMSTTRRYGGTGLGLNLVKQLVEAHGGGITVASRPGRGSVFTFTLRAWRSSVDCSPGPPSAAQRRSLAAAARAAADKAESELSRYRDDKDEEALLLPSGPSAPLLGSRRDSDPELMSRLSHDAQPLNMLQRLSGDSRLRSSYDADYTDYHKAPQQLTPKAAFNAFLTAGAHQVVREIQRGKVGEPSDVAAAAAEQEKERRQRAAAAAPPQHDWLLADRAVREGAAMAELKVLSVDDDPVNQMVVQAMLSKAGFKVLQAPDGQKALDMLESSLRHGCPPHCMLLDVMMPGLSGYDVVQLVRQRHPSLMLPVILVSANSGEEHVVEGLQAGANDYVTKPFGQRELIARIRAQLRTKHFSQGVRVEEVAEAETSNNAAARTSGETSSAGGGGGTDSPVWVSAAPSAAAAAAEPPVPNGTPPSALTLLQQVSSQPAASPAASSPGRAANGNGSGTSQPPDDTLQQQLSEAHRQLVALVTATKASCAAAAPQPPSAAAPAAATPLDKLSAAAQTPPAAAPAAAAAGPGPFAAVAPAAAVAAEARPLATNGMRRHSGSHRASWGLLDQSGSGTDLVQLQKLAGMQVGPDGTLPQASVSSADAATDSSSGKE